MAVYDKSGKPIKSGRTVSEVDKDGARELALFAENTSEIYNGILTSVLTNLQRKAKKGIYDKNKAVVAWLHVIDEAAKLYDNVHGSGHNSLQLFNKATRMEAARQLMNRLEEDVFQDVEIESSHQIKSEITPEQNKFNWAYNDWYGHFHMNLDRVPQYLEGVKWCDANKGSEFYNELCEKYNIYPTGDREKASFYNALKELGEIESVTSSKKRKPKTADERAKDEGADITCSRKTIKSSFNYYDGFENDVAFFAERYSDNDDIVEMVAGDIENEHPTESPEEFDSLMRAVHEELKRQGYFKQPWQVNSSHQIKSSWFRYTVEINTNDGNVYQEEYEGANRSEIRKDIEEDFPNMKNFTILDYEDLSACYSSRQIKSAVDGGWEVRSSDVPEALDLFVEHYGEETALEEIAKAMSTDTLLENVEWVARQWGFGEDLENVEGTWNKYEYAKEIMGVTELFNNLTQAAGYDELAEDLAFIFRQYDFREWDERNGVYSALDTWVDPRSKVDGWKVKVLDVYPDDYAGSTTAKVELFDPEGNPQGEDNIFIHRQDVKIGETYDAYIDGLMAMPRIKGVEDISYNEVPDMKKVTRDRYLKNSKEDKADEDGPHMKFKTLDEDTKFELREQIEDELEALLDKLNVKFTTDVWEETVQYILSFFEEDNAYNPKTAKQAVHEWYLDTKDDFPEMFDSKKQKVASARYCEWIRSKRLIKSAKKFFK